MKASEETLPDWRVTASAGMKLVLRITNPSRVSSASVTGPLSPSGGGGAPALSAPALGAPSPGLAASPSSVLAPSPSAACGFAASSGLAAGAARASAQANRSAAAQAKVRTSFVMSPFLTGQSLQTRYRSSQARPTRRRAYGRGTGNPWRRDG